MSTLPQQITINQYVADGITTIYTYTFLILLDLDMQVFVLPPNTQAVPSFQLQPLNVAYTIQNIGNLNGGTITFQPGFIPVAGAIITISRNMNVSIDTEFAEVQNFNGQNLDNAFERVVLIEQQLSSYQALRGITYAIDAPLPAGNTDQTLPVLGNQQIWQKVGTAIQAVTLVEGEDVSTLRAQLLSAVPGSDGASIVGYADTVNLLTTTVAAALTRLNTNAAFLSNTYTDTGTANAMAVTVPGLAAYANNVKLSISVSTTNTSALTLNVNGLGVIAVQVMSVMGLFALVGGEKIAGGVYEVIYEGGVFILLNPSKGISYYSDVYASAAFNYSTRTIINFDTLIHTDPYGLITFATHQFTVHQAGKYLISICYGGIPSGGTTQLENLIYVNNIENATVSVNPSNVSSGWILSGSRIISLNASDTIQGYFDPGTQTVTSFNGSSLTNFSVAFLGS